MAKQVETLLNPTGQASSQRPSRDRILKNSFLTSDQLPQPEVLLQPEALPLPVVTPNQQKKKSLRKKNLRKKWTWEVSLETTTEYASVCVRRDSSLFLRGEDESDRSKEWS